MIGGCRLADGTHRAATGRERRARLSHQTSPCTPDVTVDVGVDVHVLVDVIGLSFSFRLGVY
jgi:hypothetical protein